MIQSTIGGQFETGLEILERRDFILEFGSWKKRHDSWPVPYLNRKCFAFILSVFCKKILHFHRVHLGGVSQNISQIILAVFCNLQT